MQVAPKPEKDVCLTCACFGHASNTCWRTPKGKPSAPQSSCEDWLLNTHWKVSAGVEET